MISKILIALLLIQAIGYAQALDGPQGPLLFDVASRSLRSVVGLPGSAYLGTALRSDLDLASVAPNRKTILLVESGHLRSMRSDGLEANEPIAIPESIENVDRILWSLDSNAAFVFSSSNRTLQRISLAEGSFTASSPILLDSLSGTLTLVAADFPSLTAAVLARTEDGLNRLYLIPGDGSIQLLGIFDHQPAVAFQPGTDLLFVFSGDSHQISKFQNENGEWVQAHLSNILNDIEAAALLVNPDGATLYIADRNSRSIITCSSTDGTEISRLPIDIAPRAFEPIGESEFLLNPGASGEPFWTLRVQNGSLHAYFIPAGGQN